MADIPLITVSIKKPEQIVFDGQAHTVSSVSEKGKFDVLPFHANFISLIREAITIRQPNKEPLIIPITTGIMKVHSNTIKIILGIETQAAEVIAAASSEKQTSNTAGQTK